MTKTINQNAGYISMGDINIYVTPQKKPYLYFVSFPDGDFEYLTAKDSMENILDMAAQMWLKHYKKKNHKEFVPVYR
jgi:hypothetical protein